MKELRENLPVYTVIVIGISLLRLILYYQCFNIDIVSYIDATEALILSFPFFIYTLAQNGVLIIPTLLLAVVVIVVYTFGQVVRDRFKKKPTEQSSEPPKITEPTKEESSVSNTTIFLVALWIFNIGYTIISTLLSKNYTSLINSSIWYAMLGLLYLNREKTHKFLSRVILRDKQVFNLVYITLFFSLLVASLTRTEAQAVLSKGKHPHVTVFLEDNLKISSSDNLRYVGKTKGYVFFYNIKQNKAVSYSLEKANEVHIIDEKPL